MKTPGLFDLTGRVAVVTGGNGGIGRGIALGLADAGAAVAVLGRNDEKNQRVLSELRAIGVPSIAVTVDVTDRDGLEPALQCRGKGIKRAELPFKIMGAFFANVERSKTPAEMELARRNELLSN